MGKVATYSDWIIGSIPDYDTDMDGLPDWWETQYGGDSTSMSASADLDADHFTNYEEWVADTAPNDKTSYLRILRSTNVTELVFNSSTNRRYRIEYRTSLVDTNQAWQAEGDWFTPVSTQTVKSVSASEGIRLFRLNAKLP